MSVVWDEFVTATGAHGVELYSEVEELGESVADFFREGLRRGEPALLVGTPAQVEAVRARLDPAELTVADAEETLAQLVREPGWVSKSAFDEVIGSLLDRAGGEPRVFGSMVDLLVQRGEAESAEALESLWNGLLRRRRFSLLCGYHLDVFDLGAQQVHVPAICRAHSHVVPAHDAPRFAKAVDRALVDVLGAARARDVHYIVERSLRGRRVPAAQDALRWVTANLPTQAEHVLAAARAAYAA